MFNLFYIYILREGKQQRDYNFIPVQACLMITCQEYSQPSFLYFTNFHNRRGDKFQCFVHQLLRSNALFLWRHEDTSLLCLLSNDNSCRQVISNFSLR